MSLGTQHGFGDFLFETHCIRNQNNFTGDLSRVAINTFLPQYLMFIINHFTFAYLEKITFILTFSKNSNKSRK